MTSDERLYFVVYDIADPKRWRSVFKTMHGYGDWVQLSVFQCRLTRVRHAELIADLDNIIHNGEDHVVIIDIGPVDNVEPQIVSLGKRAYTPITREPIICLICRWRASTPVVRTCLGTARSRLAP